MRRTRAALLSPGAIRTGRSSGGAPARRRDDLPGADAGSAPDRRRQHHARPGALALGIVGRAAKRARTRLGRWPGSISPIWIPSRAASTLSWSASSSSRSPARSRVDARVLVLDEPTSSLSPPRGRAPLRGHRAPARARGRRWSTSATFSKRCARSRRATRCCATAAGWSTGQVARQGCRCGIHSAHASQPWPPEHRRSLFRGCRVNTGDAVLSSSTHCADRGRRRARARRCAAAKFSGLRGWSAPAALRCLRVAVRPRPGREGLVAHRHRLGSPSPAIVAP